MDILIEGEICKDCGENGTVDATQIRAALKEVENAIDKTVRFVIDSPGGSVWEGVAIYNEIRDFCRNHADFSVSTYIKGMAASMASVIALAPSAVLPRAVVSCEDNSVFMIHKAWGLCVGNADEMQKEGALLSKIDNLIVNAYAKKSHFAQEKLLKMMSEETWFFGEEILTAGFADEIVSTQNDFERDELMSEAFARFGACNAKIRKMEEKAQSVDFDAVALALQENESFSKNNKTEELQMNLEQFKAQNPELYKEICDEARKEGAANERKRSARFLAMAEKSGSADARAFALKCISDGANPSDEVIVDAFMDFNVSAKMRDALAKDEKVADVSVPKNELDDNGDYFDKLDRALLGI